MKTTVPGHSIEGEADHERASVRLDPNARVPLYHQIFLILRNRIFGGEVQPDVNVQVALDAKKRSAENQYEVITKLTIESKNKAGGETLFVLEL
ncbi:protein-export chaperone SecB, partial [Thalassobaculum salexigens]|uniref:protein-export chaperone SecB n=1 Tax=Thalassobaculum salexigens TaxID=455360 RepID=UPI00248EA65E